MAEKTGQDPSISAKSPQAANPPSGVAGESPALDKPNGKPTSPANDFQPRNLQLGQNSPRTKHGSTADGDFDPYGAELEPEARVWKTYMSEADRFDTDKVNEWNKSLDIILLFAALFSAIATAFIIESLNDLREDPADTSSQTLTTISQTLLAIANNSRPLALPNPESALVNETFTPSPAAVWVNALWFLSLSLSVAVSLFAMLAKEWCYLFISNRNGHTCEQTQERQKRWDGVVKWRMPELLAILPSMIHLALFLFAIGLCVYLWDIHPGVAAPVVVVTIGASIVYLASTTLPLLFDYCPYSTTLLQTAKLVLSRVMDAWRKRSGGNYSFRDESPTQDSDGLVIRDSMAGQALAWLIESSKDPKSVDVALQAIAGAEGCSSLEPLLVKEPEVKMMVYKRLIAGSTYLENYELVFGLYARALAALQPTKHLPQGEENNRVNELQRMLRTLQTSTEKNVIKWLTAEGFVLTPIDLSALSAGSKCASLCLNFQSHPNSDQVLEALNSGVKLIENHYTKLGRLHIAVLRALVIGMSMVFACTPLRPDPAAESTPYLVRLLDTNLDEELLSILLAAFALSQNDYNEGEPHASGVPVARAERAIALVSKHASTLDDPNSIPAGALNILGLLALLADPTRYRLKEHDFSIIHSRFSAVRSVDTGFVHIFPKTSTLRQYATGLISKMESWDFDMWAGRASATAYLKTLHYAYAYNQSAEAPSPYVYIMVVESICRLPSSSTRIESASLFKSFQPAQISNDLVYLVRSRDIIALLSNALDSEDKDVSDFAASQLGLFMGLVQSASSELTEASSALLISLSLCEGIWNTDKWPSLGAATGSVLRYITKLIGDRPNGGFQQEYTPESTELANSFIPIPQIYILVVDVILGHSKADLLAPMLQELAEMFSSTDLYDRLAVLASSGKTVSSLVECLRSDDWGMKDFASRQLRLFMEFIQTNKIASRVASDLLLDSMAQCNDLWGLPEQPVSLRESFSKLRKHRMDFIDGNLSVLNIQGNTPVSAAFAETSLRVLHQPHNPLNGTLSPQVYVFVVESACLFPSTLAQSAIKEICSDSHPNEASRDLIDIIDKRGVVSRLSNALKVPDNFLKAFAAVQLQLFMKLGLQNSRDPTNTSSRLLTCLFQCSELWDSTQSLAFLGANGSPTSPHGYMLSLVSRRLPKSKHQITLFSSEELIRGYLRALLRIYDKVSERPAPHVYVFVLESICRFSSNATCSLAMNVFQKLPPLELSNHLGYLIEERGIIQLLSKVAHPDYPLAEDFAMKQLLWFIERSIIQVHNKLTDGAEHILTSLYHCNELWSLSNRDADMSKALSDLRVVMLDLISSNLRDREEWRVASTDAHCAKSYLHALHRLSTQPTRLTRSPSPWIYIFALGSSCGTISDDSDVKSLATDLLLKFVSPNITYDLVVLLDKHSIVSLLVKALDSPVNSLQDIAIQLLCRYISFVMKPLYDGQADRTKWQKHEEVITPIDSDPDNLRDISNILLRSLIRCNGIWQLPDEPKLAPLRASLEALRHYLLVQIARLLSNPEEQEQLFANEMPVKQTLQILKRLYGRRMEAPAQLYVFVVESICREPSKNVKSLGLELLDSFLLPVLSMELAASTSRRKLASLFAKALESQDEDLHLFVRVQSYLLVNLILPTQHTESRWLRHASDLLLSALSEGDGSVDLDVLKRKLAEDIAETKNSNRRDSLFSLNLKPYSDRVLRNIKPSEA